jgi:hypothetical protein
MRPAAIQNQSENIDPSENDDSPKRGQKVKGRTHFGNWFA